LHPLTNLRYVNLGGTGVSEQGVRDLRKVLPGAHIEYKESINDFNVSLLGCLAKRRVLVCDGNYTTDVVLAQLAGLTELEELVLDDSRITDAGLSNLQGLPSLKKVSLKRTETGDAALKYLETCLSLRELNLRFTSVSSVGITELQRALPDCRITAPWGEASKGTPKGKEDDSHTISVE
jgi:hypothetical protein